MSVKSYLATCGVFLLVALAFLATGNFTMMTGVVFGFLAFGLTFAGMMCVLPATVSHPAPAKVAAERTPVVSARAVPAKGFGTLKSA